MTFPSPTTAELRGRLHRHHDDIHRLVTEYRATDAQVCGSVARGDATSSSDIDVLVDFCPNATMLDEVGLRLALTDLLGVSVDVVALDTLRGANQERILRDATRL